MTTAAPVRGALALVAAVALAAGAVSSAGCTSGSSSAPIRTDAGAHDSGTTGSGGSTGTGGTSGGGGFATGAGGSTTGGGGSSGGSGGSGGSATGSAGAGGSPVDGGVTDGGSDAAPPPCQVLLTAVSAVNFLNLEVGPTVKLRLRGDIVNGTAAPSDWRWTVEFQGATPIPVTAVDTGQVIEFPLTAVGSYDIAVQVQAGMTCRGGQVISARAPQPAAFIFRATPPAASAIPASDITTTLPSDRRTLISLELGGANPVTILPKNDADAVVSAYVRVTTPSSAGLGVEGYTARGPLVTALQALVTYDVLIVPDDTTLAPQLVSGTPLSRWPIVLDRGVPVTGSALDAGGTAVPGARVVLRAGERPSTIGVTDSAGNFALLARAGTLAAVIAPAAGSGLPEAHISATPGIVLPSSAASVDLAMRWSPATVAPLSLTVRAVDNSAAVSGASVHVQSAAELSAVGTVTVRVPGAAPVMLSASGSVRADGVSDSAGMVKFPALRAGSYRVTIVPPATAAAGTAITGVDLELPAGGLARQVVLSRKVTVTGTLLPTAETAGVRVTAIDRDVMASGALATVTAGAGGRYQLQLDPGRNYQLVAEPPASASLARAVLGTLLVDPATPSAGERTVPAGAIFSGVATSFGVPLAGVLIQVYCPGASATCLDPTVAVGEVVSGSDGTFKVVLPDVAAAH